MADLFVFTDARGLPRGPADVQTLRAWLAEGILAEDTRLTRAGTEENPHTSTETVLARDLLGSSPAPSTSVSSSSSGVAAAETTPVTIIKFFPPDEASGSNLRPLTNSELLDRTFQVYRHHFLQLFVMASLINLPPFLLHAVMHFVGVDKQWLSIFIGGDILSHLPPVHIIALAVGLGMMITILEWMAMSVMTAYVADLYLEKRVTLARAFWALRGKFWKLLVTHTLRTMLFFVLACLPIGTLCIMILFNEHLNIWTTILLILATLGLLAPILVYTVHTLLTSQAIMLEGRYGFSALWRSSLITRYDPRMGPWYWGETRLSMLLLVFLATTLLVGIVGGAPNLLTQERLGLGIPDSPTINTLQQLLSFLGFNLVSPLYVLGATVFYYDVRVRREGYDLEVMARRLQAAEAARKPPA